MSTIYGFDVPFSFSDLVVIGYLLIHFFLLFLLTLCACERGLKCCDWIKKLWITGGIYSPLIVQFCDQATDLGVLILWFELAIKERNDELDVEHVNMTLFFGISAICIFIYRIVIIIAACMADNYDGKRCFPLFLSFFDLLFIYEVYFAQSHGFDELSEDMRTYQLLECVFESIPQIILQSVFVLRVWPNREDSEIDLKYEILLISSIILSLLNICNKYKWRDLHHQWVDSELCSKMNLRIEKCCCHGKCCSFILFSKYWFLHGIWRFVHILARIVLLVLLWSVLGGALLSLFLLLLFLSFIYCFQKYEYIYIGPSSSSSGDGNGDGDGGDTGSSSSNGVACKDWFFAALISFITTHVIGATSDDSPTRSVLGYRMLLRLFEYVIGLGLIWSFINFSDTLDCPKYVCSSVENRDWDNNEMIKIYVYVGFGAVGLDFFTFILMYALDLFQISDGSDGNDDTFGGTNGGAPSPVMKVQTSEVDRDDDNNNNTNNVGGDNGNLNAPNFVTTASASSVPQQFEFAVTQQQQQQQQEAQQQQEEQDEEQGTNDDDDDDNNDNNDIDDNGNENNNDDNDDNDDDDDDDDMKIEIEKETAGGDVAIGAALDTGNEPQMENEHDSQHDDDDNNNNNNGNDGVNNDNDIELAIQDKTYQE